MGSITNVQIRISAVTPDANTHRQRWNANTTNARNSMTRIAVLYSGATGQPKRFSIRHATGTNPTMRPEYESEGARFGF